MVICGTPLNLRRRSPHSIDFICMTRLRASGLSASSPLNLRLSRFRAIEHSVMRRKTPEADWTGQGGCPIREGDQRPECAPKRHWLSRSRRPKAAGPPPDSHPEGVRDVGGAAGVLDELPVHRGDPVLRRSRLAGMTSGPVSAIANVPGSGTLPPPPRWRRSCPETRLPWWKRKRQADCFNIAEVPVGPGELVA